MERGNRYPGIDEYAVKLIKHKARQLIGKPGFVSSDLGDIEQDLMVDLLRRLPKYDQARAQLNTFCARVIEHRIATLIEEMKGGDSDPSFSGGSLNDKFEDAEGNTVEPIDIISEDDYRHRTNDSFRPIEERIVFSIDTELVISVLPPELQNLCRLLATNNIKDISRMGIRSRASVYRDIEKLRAIFKDVDPKKRIRR